MKERDFGQPSQEIKEKLPTGEIPALRVEGRTFPEAWERSLLTLWENGTTVATEYDKPEDPQSRDSTMMIVIHEPMAEPRIHRLFPGGLEDLEEYRQEVVDGIKDHWVDGKEGHWSYTYHGRLFSYPAKNGPLDQVEIFASKLAETPFSRRAQAITWNSELDANHSDPPCLQRIWCRILQNEQGEPVLNMNTHWRSRDAFKAAYMNIFALTDLQRKIAEQISEKMGREVKVGRYVDISDSYHIYGSYFQELQGVLKNLQTRTPEQKTWTSEFAADVFEEAKVNIAKKLEALDRQWSENK